MASAGPSGAAGSVVEQCADVFLRAWLCARSPQPITEMENDIEQLASTAIKDRISKAGGLEKFIARAPDLVVNDGQVVPILATNLPKPIETSLLSQIDKFTDTQLAVINQTLCQVQLAPKNSAIVTALEKRARIDDLRRECHRKRMALDEKKRHFDELQSDSVSEERRKKLNRLIEHRDRLQAKVRERADVLQRKTDLDDASRKLDKRIADTEDQLNRIKLKITRAEEHIVLMKQDGFSEGAELERRINDGLRRHDADRERTIGVLDVIADEKCAHSKAVLELYILSIRKLLAEGDAPSEHNTENLVHRLRQYEQKLLEINAIEVDIRKKLHEQQADLTQVLQLPVIEIHQLDTDTSAAIPQASSGQPLILRSLVEDELPHGLCPTDDAVPQTAANSNQCTICLHEMLAETTETLACLHSFHSSCLRNMRSFGYDLCPLCRRYEPPPEQFPSLSDASSEK